MMVALVEVNIAWLGQAAELLEDLEDGAFAKVGVQFRHIIEFYECLFDGCDKGYVDYDARRRDRSIQTRRRVAREKVLMLMTRLEREDRFHADRPVFVRVEDAAGLGLRQPYMSSSLSRELQSLGSHTVHHFALIAMTLRNCGVTVDSAFGVAPSTLRFRAAMSGAA